MTEEKRGIKLLLALLYCHNFCNGFAVPTPRSQPLRVRALTLRKSAIGWTVCGIVAPTQQLYSRPPDQWHNSGTAEAILKSIFNNHSKSLMNLLPLLSPMPQWRADDRQNKESGEPSEKPRSGEVVGLSWRHKSRVIDAIGGAQRRRSARKGA